MTDNDELQIAFVIADWKKVLIALKHEGETRLAKVVESELKQEE